MNEAPKLLVLDAYPTEGRARLRDVGGTEAGKLYRALLKRLAPGAQIEIAYPADSEAPLPRGRRLGDYDGIVWTGSSLTIHDHEDARVRHQIELGRAIYREGVPSFGSCWAVQLSVVAAGGRCDLNPRGRELGIARAVRLEAEGRAHPMYAGKPERFDAFACHADHVVELPPGAQLLATNEWSRVQAVGVEQGAGVCWAVQYHPEYDLHEVASLCRLRRDDWVAQGTYESLAEADRVIAEMEALHADSSRIDLAERLGVGASLIDPDVRSLEVRNWLERCVASR